MSGDKNISQLGAKILEFHPNDLVILRDFVTNKDVKTTYAQLLAALGSGNGLNAYEVAVLEGFIGTEAEWLASLEGIDGFSAYEIAVANGYVGTEVEWLASLQGIDGTPGGITGFPASDGKVYGIKNQAPFELVDTTAGRRVVSTELIITGTTTGILNAQWYNDVEVLRTLTNEAITFLALPSAGNYRWVLIEGLDDGTFALNNQDPVAAAPARPTPTAGRVVLGEAIFDSDGNVQQPAGSGGGSANAGPFPVLRYETMVSAGTTGKFAKVWEGALSKDGNYSIQLAYHEPLNGVSFEGSGLCRLRASWTCDTSRNILPDTVQLETDGESVNGEFQLVQIAGNRAALYHRSNHFWGRIQFRVLFSNSNVRTQDFLDAQAYGASLPGGTVYASVVSAGGAGGGSTLITFSTVINMDGNYKSTTTQTGAIAITKGVYQTPATNFESKTVQIIEANGTGGKPTFSIDFVVQMDTWSNNTGDINQLIYKGSPSGKILVWMDNVELA